MAQACDQCRRVPAGSQLGEKHLWIKMEIPRGIIVHPQDPPDYSGLNRGVSTVYDTMQFCTVGCTLSYMTSAERKLGQTQMDSAEIMRQTGVLPFDHHEPLSEDEVSP